MDSSHSLILRSRATVHVPMAMSGMVSGPTAHELYSGGGVGKVHDVMARRVRRITPFMTSRYQTGILRRTPANRIAVLGGKHA